MAGIFNGPPRGGTRGGKDQFNWDSVKADQDREYYLGHSVKALQGRWQKGKDVYWYTREKEEAQDGSAEARRSQEMQAVKQREQDLMMEALGLRPKAPPKQLAQPRLDQTDMQKLLGPNGEEGEDEGAAGATEQVDRVKGLGFNASRLTGAVQTGTQHETLAGVGAGKGAGMAGAQRAGSSGAAAAAVRLQGSGGAGLSVEQIEAAKRLKRKEEKRTAKRARKEAKRAKHESKKSRKRSQHEEEPSQKDGVRGRQPLARSPPSSGTSDGDSNGGAGGIMRDEQRGGSRRSRSPPPRQDNQRRTARSRSRDKSRDRGKSPPRRRRHAPHTQQLQQGRGRDEDRSPVRRRSPSRSRSRSRPRRRRGDSDSERRGRQLRSPPDRR